MAAKVIEDISYVPYNSKIKKVLKNGHYTLIQDWDYCEVKSIPSIFNSLVRFNRSSIKAVLEKLNKKENCFKALKIKMTFEETHLIG